MNMKLSAKTKRIIVVYVIILGLLAFIVEGLPRVTDLFETTEVLTVGNLALSCETTGYLVKDEHVCIADETGDIEYTEEVGTVVKKGHKLATVTAKQSDSNSQGNNRYSKYTERLGNYKNVTDSYKAPISGVFSLTIDGYEGVFTKEKMKELDKATVEGYSYDSTSLERSAIYDGEPVYKVSGDDEWYVLCWVNKPDAEHYPVGEDVTLQLPDGDVAATVNYSEEEGDVVRLIFELDVYYKNFTDARQVEMTVVARADEGLIVDNSCIVEKDGVKGVYVVDKNNNAKFTQIRVISTDGERSVLKDTSYYDEDGNQVMTVDVYDKVLKHPESALNKDLEEGDD